jgi:hypothetical protein
MIVRRQSWYPAGHSERDGHARALVQSAVGPGGRRAGPTRSSRQAELQILVRRLRILSGPCRCRPACTESWVILSTPSRRCRSAYRLRPGSTASEPGVRARTREGSSSAFAPPCAASPQVRHRPQDRRRVKAAPPRKRKPIRRLAPPDNRFRSPPNRGQLLCLIARWLPGWPHWR